MEDGALLTTSRSGASFLSEDHLQCAWENSKLATWTFLRYCALGLILFWRVWWIRRGARDLMFPFRGRSPYCQHPILTRHMLKAPFGADLVLAGCMFVQTEGIGLTIYFSASAIMDNATIFFTSGDGLCHTITAVSLYTMALVTFLPNVWLGIALQAKYYDHGNLLTKSLYVAGMIVITSAFFMVRLLLVYDVGYVWLINWLLASRAGCDCAPTSPMFRVVLAVIVPPLTDAVQSVVLISTDMEPEQEAMPLES